MMPNNDCYEIIENFEGLELAAYPDEGGVWTIGYGTTEYPDGTPVKPGDTCTQADAQRWLQHDVEDAASAVNDAFPRPGVLSQEQFNALTSLTYNIGVGAFKGSTLLHLAQINPSDPAIYNFTPDGADGCGQPHSCKFLDWVYVRKQISKVLVERRSQEAQLYASGVGTA